MWSIDGESLANYLDYMERIEGAVKGDHYVLYPAANQSINNIRYAHSVARYWSRRLLMR
jgi:hypothetical protein